MRLGLLLCFLWRRWNSKYNLSVFYCSNFNDRRATREYGSALALLEFVCVAGIAVRMVEKGRKAFEKECPSTARVVHRRARMCNAHCRRQGAVLHAIEKACRYLTGLDRWTSGSVAVHQRLLHWYIEYRFEEVFKASFFEHGVNVPCVRVFVLATSDQ